MEEKDFIWVSKGLAAEFKKIGDADELERAVKKVIESKRLDLEHEQEYLSENLLMFKSVCLSHKRELEKVYKEQADNLYSLWEEMGDVTTMVNKHAREVAGHIEPLRREVDGLRRNIQDLRQSISGLDLYVPQQLADVTTQVAQMDEKTKALLSTLLNHKG